MPSAPFQETPPPFLALLLIKVELDIVPLAATQEIPPPSCSLAILLIKVQAVK